MFSVVNLANSCKNLSSQVLISLFSIILFSGAVHSTTPVCGDRITQSPEQCDDGNTISGDGCSSTCRIEPICGNQIAEPSEECDKGLPINGTRCWSCRFIIASTCGNGVVDPMENCDPVLSPNTCNGDCTFSSCGDGKIGPREECDGGGMSKTCNSNCRLSACGDGLLNTQSGEECDPGLITGSCNWNCKFNICGDSIVNQLAGEQCDPPGNMTNGDTCSPTCQIIFAATQAPGAGSLDTGTIIGIAIGVAGLLAGAIPLALVYRKYRKTHGCCGSAPTVTAAVPMNNNPAFQAGNP